MTKVSMLELRRNSEKLIYNLEKKGMSFILVYRGREIAYLTPVQKKKTKKRKDDPIFNLSNFAVDMGSLKNSEIDSILYA